MREIEYDTLPTQSIGESEKLAPPDISGEINESMPSALPIGVNAIANPTMPPTERRKTGVIHRESSDALRDAMETDSSVSMNLLNQSAQSMLEIIQAPVTTHQERIAAANALAQSMQTQVNMVRALTSVLKLSRKASVR